MSSSDTASADARSTIVKTELVARKNWVQLKLIHWRDPTGRDRIWESAERTTRKGEIDAVEVFAIIRQSGHPPSCLLVKQFRPPVGVETIEFPAGLIDEGETPEQAALRELKEETGYVGTVRSVSPIVFADAGMTNANMVTVFVDVDGELEENRNPIATPDEGEFIKVYQVPIHGLIDRLRQLDAEGCGVDSRVWNFAEGMLVQQMIASK